MIQTELYALEQNKTISEKLLNLFPGYYSRFLCLHFSSFLKDPIITPVQQKAFKKIVEFLDNAPNLVFPEELQEYIDENTGLLGTQEIIGMTESIKNSITDPTKYMADSKEGLEQYIEYKKSDEYKNSHVKLNALNEIMLEQYPEIREWDT